MLLLQPATQQILLSFVHTQSLVHIHIHMYGVCKYILRFVAVTGVQPHQLSYLTHAQLVLLYLYGYG